ncbi:MAG TPA: CRTAC1 family protein [Chitinophagales bacterium]|nr:CRTAC1 family protein [Chitinophagales bacterium]
MKRKLLIFLSVIVVLGIATAFIIKNKKVYLTSYFKDIRTDYPKDLEGNAAMIAYLNSHAEDIDKFDNKYSNLLRLHDFQNKPIPSDPVEAILLKCQIAREYLNVGEAGKARELFAEVVKDPAFKKIPPKMQDYYRHLNAVSNLRYAEIQNCITNHNKESCVFPITGNGVHLDRTGSESAIAIYKDLIKTEPKNSSEYLISQWLLNIAYMTLGEYPANVPAEYLMPDLGKDSGYPLDKFYDVAMSAGVAKDGLSGGVALDDFNNDGYIDIFTCGWQTYEQITYYENNRNGTFSDKTEQTGLMGMSGGLNLTQGDYNGDGNMDLFIMRGGWWDNYGCTANSLIKNNGDGTFTDVTKEAGVLSFHPCQTAKFEDFNNDGSLDLMLGNESSQGSPDHPVELYMNNGDGTFKNFAKQAGIDVRGYVKGIATGDFDNDGYMDVAFSLYMSNNLLFRNTTGDNNGKLGFENVTKKAGISGPKKSFPTWFFDYDNDGDMDLFIAAFDNEKLDRVPSYIMGVPYDKDINQFYKNNGDGTFTSITEELHLDQPTISMGANFGDLDNDGWLDFYLGTGNPDYRTLIPNLMFRNNAGKDFQDVTYTGGFGHLQKGHGIGFADFDMDGDQDIYEVLGGAFMGDNFPNALLENPGNTNAWINISLKGTKSNLDGIGARIKVTAIYPDSTSRDIYMTVNSGASFGSSPYRKEIGLANAISISELEVIWPGKKTVQKFYNIKPNSFIEIHEDKSEVKYNTFIPFEFLKNHDHMNHSMM